jgi:hypothetical protein
MYQHDSCMEDAGCRSQLQQQRDAGAAAAASAARPS